MEQKVIDRLAKGITVGGVEYGPIKVTPIEKRRSEEETSTNEWVYVSLTEGKNREIRRVFEHFKLVVTRLIRVQYGYSGLSLSETTRDAANFGAFVRPYTLDKKLEPGDVVETRLRLDLVKKADRYWWLWYAVVHMQPSSWLCSVGGGVGGDTPLSVRCAQGRRQGGLHSALPRVLLPHRPSQDHHQPPHSCLVCQAAKCARPGQPTSIHLSRVSLCWVGKGKMTKKSFFWPFRLLIFHGSTLERQRCADC